MNINWVGRAEIYGKVSTLPSSGFTTEQHLLFHFKHLLPEVICRWEGSLWSQQVIPVLTSFCKGLGFWWGQCGPEVWVGVEGWRGCLTAGPHMVNAFSSAEGGWRCGMRGKDGGRRSWVAKRVPCYGMTEQRCVNSFNLVSGTYEKLSHQRSLLHLAVFFLHSSHHPLIF